jgi:uncharacterized protein YbaR (Trm112 family)
VPARRLDNDLLSILACPKCKGDLTLAGDEKGLICESCRIVYPVREGVPVMLIEEAFPMRAEKTQKGEGAVQRVPSGEKAVFLIVEGKNKGERIELEKGTCRALGRTLDDAERTKIFAVDAAVSLDDNSKKVVMQYLSRQFHKGEGAGGGMKTARPKGGGEDLGGFVRESDVPLKDSAISRLHAMLFFDDSGLVGILDLVSKNGTYVNGAEVESKILKKGDLITVGGTKIRFES